MKKGYLILLLATICLLVLVVTVVWNYRQFYQHYSTYRFPGEFEKQQAIWLQWPSEVYNVNDRPVNPVIINIIKALTPLIKVNLMAKNTAEIIQIKDLFRKNGFSGSRVHFYIVNHRSIWARDVGPIFVKDRQNRLHIVNFGFNNYSRGGDPYYIYTESQIDKVVAGLLKLPVINSKLISEGGAIESNGKGTLMITAAVVLKRNPELSKIQIAKEYQRVLGVQKVIWLNKGLAEDDQVTSGHINEIARFASPNTILLAKVLPVERNKNRTIQESYQRLEENYRILKKATDQDGKPFSIIRIPMPPSLYGEPDNTGNIPIYSYLNFVITNGAVLMQTYWRPGRSNTLKTTEEQVKRIFQRIFPGRKILGINAEHVNLWGGGIHCITQHMPATDSR
jgi:agmatine deiminase